MADSYWRAVHRRALKDTFHVLQIESVERAVIALIIGIGTIAGIWLLGGSSNAEGELITRTCATGAILAIFPIVYLWKFIQAPARLDAEKQNRIVALEEKIVAETEAHKLQSDHTLAIKEQTDELRQQRLLKLSSQFGSAYLKQNGTSIAGGPWVRYADMTIEKKVSETAIRISANLLIECHGIADCRVIRKNGEKDVILFTQKLDNYTGVFPILIIDQAPIGSHTYTISFQTSSELRPIQYIKINYGSVIEAAEVFSQVVPPLHQRQ